MSAKRVASIGLLLVFSAMGLTNIICAVLFGGVWLTRTGADWIYFDSNPVRFFWTLALSIVAFAGLGGIGILGVYSARSERRFLDRLSSQPRFDDGSNTSRVGEP